MITSTVHEARFSVQVPYHAWADVEAATVPSYGTGLSYGHVITFTSKSTESEEDAREQLNSLLDSCLVAFAEQRRVSQ